MKSSYFPAMLQIILTQFLTLEKSGVFFLKTLVSQFPDDLAAEMLLCPVNAK